MSQTTLTIIIGSGPSTSVTCTLEGPFTAPVAPGTVIGSIAVVPSDWSGVFTLSGPNAGSFAIAGTNLVVGAAPLAEGSYEVTLTATP